MKRCTFTHRPAPLFCLQVDDVVWSAIYRECPIKDLRHYIPAIIMGGA